MRLVNRAKMEKSSRIYVAGHRGLVGSAIRRELEGQGYLNLLLSSHAELDLTDRSAVDAFFSREQPEYVFLAAAKVGEFWRMTHIQRTLFARTC